MCFELATSAFSVSPPEGGRLEPDHPLFVSTARAFFVKRILVRAEFFPSSFATLPDSLDLVPIDDELYKSPLKTLQKAKEWQPDWVVH